MATPTALPAAFTVGQVLTSADMNLLRGAMRVLQVVSTTKVNLFSASVAGGASVDVTGLSATITPTSSTSKVFVTVNMNGMIDVSGSYRPFFAAQLKRGATLIGGGTAAGSRISINASGGYSSVGDVNANISFSFLDSPSTTSATTYQVAGWNPFSLTTTLTVNQFAADGDSATTGRMSSTITIMEISA